MPIGYDQKVQFGAGEIIGYRQMCDHENASLQRGMNYRLNPGHSVVLTSVRAGAPYDDEIQEEGQVLVYKGHDVPRGESNPIPKTINQELKTPAGTPTENGRFFKSAQQFKDELRPAEALRV